MIARVPSFILYVKLCVKCSEETARNTAHESLLIHMSDTNMIRPSHDELSRHKEIHPIRNQKLLTST